MATDSVDPVEAFKTYFELHMPAGVDVVFDTEGLETDNPPTLLITCRTRDRWCTQRVDMGRILNPETLAAVHARAFRDELLRMETDI